jgi:uncharacterized protein YyaL (SSP411 family)
MTITWHPWTAETAALAQACDRPLLVWLSDPLDHYSARWQRERDNDADLLALIEAAFVPVAVDRTRHPALAARAQEVLGLTAGAAGWPAVALFTPDGHAIGATPYGPLRDADKRRGLVRVLVAFSEMWVEEREALLAEAHGMAGAWDHLATVAAAAPRNLALAVQGIAAHAMEQADTIEGGFGPPPRRPDATLLRFLATQQAEAPAIAEHLQRTITAIAAGGIHDQLGGGIHRATRDESWSLPFFEKRLADQALLARTLLADHGQQLAHDVALRALHWALDALRLADGTLAHGLHAESPGAEGEPVDGAYYLWTRQAMADVIGREAAAACWRRLAADERQELTDGWRALAVRGELDPADRDRLPSWCRRLLVARGDRPAPPRCERVLLAEQGMLLSALSAAITGGHDGDGDLRAAGDALARVLAIVAPPDPTAAADAAWLALGLAQWAALGDDPQLMEYALIWIRWLAERRDGRGLLHIAEDPLLAQPALDGLDTVDGPAAGAVLAEAALVVAPRAPDEGLTVLASELVAAHAGLVRAAPLAAASWARVADRLE